MRAFPSKLGILFFLFTAMISACTVGNKIIPDPNGKTFVDTMGTLGNFTLIVTGDTSFTTNILSDSILNVVKDDSLVVVGADSLVNTKIIVSFATASADTGTYLTETSPPGITTAVFGTRLLINGVPRIYLMTHGKIIISENDTINNTVKGSFDVNNEFSGADKTLFMRANFYLRYKD
ncbi:MAG: hypothetical protein R2739_02425 [Chitinophagales bacterium]